MLGVVSLLVISKLANRGEMSTMLRGLIVLCALGHSYLVTHLIPEVFRQL